MKEGAGISIPSADAGRSRLILIVAGEASADLHGSSLVRAITKMEPGVVFWGIGGKEMGKAGVKILFPSSEMAVVGLTEVFSRLRRITKAYVRLKSILKHVRPDLLILIDYPDFNIHLASIAKRCKVPVLYYISPQVWAWRRGRVKKIARLVDRMAVILPFEQEFYRRRGMLVDYVGHPLQDSAPRDLKRGEVIRELGLQNSGPILGLLPGSRKEEVMNLLPVMIKAAEIISSHYPALKCLLPLASTVSSDLVLSMIGRTHLQIEILQGGIYRALGSCDLALVASGTATLETAIMEVPMVIVYRVSPISFWIAKMVVKVPHIGLVNLVAGERIVPELVQDEVTPERLAREALSILQSSQENENMVNRLRAVRERLGKGSASERTAEIAMEIMARRA